MEKKLGFTLKQKKEIKATLGINLAAARRNIGMSQSDVMKILWGVDNNRNRISEIENGKKDLTICDLLLFQELYGQSLDYLCGLSTEPEVDMLAGMVNNIVTQSRSLTDFLASEIASVVTDQMKAICKSDYVALVNEVKNLCKIINQDAMEGKATEEAVASTKNAMHVIRHIEVKQTRQQQGVIAQTEKLRERLLEPNEIPLFRTIDSHYSYNNTLPKFSMGYGRY